MPSEKSNNYKKSPIISFGFLFVKKAFFWVGLFSEECQPRSQGLSVGRSKMAATPPPPSWIAQPRDPGNEVGGMLTTQAYYLRELWEWVRRSRRQLGMHSQPCSQGLPIQKRKTLGTDEVELQCALNLVSL